MSFLAAIVLLVHRDFEPYGEAPLLPVVNLDVRVALVLVGRRLGSGAK